MAKDLTHIYLQVLIEMYDELEILDEDLQHGDIPSGRAHVRRLREQLEALTGAKRVMFSRRKKE